MIKTETRIVNNVEFDYTYSTLSVYIMNESGQKYTDVYDLKDYPHTYTETDELIDDGEMDGKEQQDWLEFLKEYEFFFGDHEYVFSKYKVVKLGIEKDVWHQIKGLMTEDIKDLFDAALEFSSTDDNFKKFVYSVHTTLNWTLLQIRNFLDQCLKD